MKVINFIYKFYEILSQIWVIIVLETKKEMVSMGTIK